MSRLVFVLLFFFFFNDTATTEIYTLSLHDALPILTETPFTWYCTSPDRPPRKCPRSEEHTSELQSLTNLVCRLLLEKKKKQPRPSLVNEFPHVELWDLALHPPV